MNRFEESPLTINIDTFREFPFDAQGLDNTKRFLCPVLLAVMSTKSLKKHSDLLRSSCGNN